MLDCSFTSLRRAVKSTYAAKKIIKKKSHHMGVNAAAATKVCGGEKNHASCNTLHISAAHLSCLGTALDSLCDLSPQSVQLLLSCCNSTFSSVSAVLGGALGLVMWQTGHLPSRLMAFSARRLLPIFLSADRGARAAGSSLATFLVQTLALILPSSHFSCCDVTHPLNLL